jgi:hypothetical protein
LLPPLLSTNPKWTALAAALLLATGRRTVEIMKTGDFYLNDDQTPDGYECMFSGQAKSGLENDQPYLIPLLAPFSLVKKGLDTLREMKKADFLSSSAVNEAFASGLNFYTKKAVGMNPHALRAAYGMMTTQLAKKKISLMGHLQNVMGHSTTKPSAAYQRVRIANLTGPFDANTPAKKNEPLVAPVPQTDWIANTTPEKKRVEAIKELMMHKKTITASSVRAFAGASMPVIQRVMANNKALIDAYNKQLL